MSTHPLATSLMQRLRQSTRRMAWFALLYVLALGAASANTAIQSANAAPNQQLICTGTGGMAWVTMAVDGSVQTTPVSDAARDCPLCALTQLPALLSNVSINSPSFKPQDIPPAAPATSALATAVVRLPPPRGPPATS